MERGAELRDLSLVLQHHDTDQHCMMQGADYHYSTHRIVTSMPRHVATVIMKADNADLDVAVVKTTFDFSFQILIRRLQTLTKNPAKLMLNNCT